VASRIRARLAREEGFTLIELVTTMAILGFVLSGIIAVSVSGLHAQTDMNLRFQAQQNARVALTGMRNDIRTACQESVPADGMSVTLTYACGGTTSQVTWCASSSSGSAPYGLYRQAGAVCSYSTGVQRADQITTTDKSGNPVTIFAPLVVSGSHPQLQVTLPVDANLANTQGLYTLTDTMTLRNAAVS